MAKRIILPIDNRLDEIVGLLDDHQVVIVQAETGAGKTTRIPQAALAAGFRVNMTQTRRAAVRWNGRRIADELSCKPGELVGWRLRGEEPVMSADTRLIIRMDQSVLRIIRNGRLPEGLLIIDEAHERSVSIDLLLGLVKQYLPVSPNTKVLVTSATIDTEKFSAYFDGAPVVTVPGRVFPVSTEVVQMHRYEHHTEAASRAARSVFDRFLAGTLTTPAAEGAGTQSVTGGTVIVLLPGKEDIRNVMSDVRETAERLGASDRVEILPCHGESTPAEQDAIQAPVPDGTLRFVCGTEVLRNSVTVMQTVGVVDSMQVKRLVVTPRGVSALMKVSVSRAEADQAKGRAGRTAPGFYIAVSFGREYDTLATYPQPAILREPIAHVVLQVAAAGLDARTFQFLDRPSEDHVNVAIRRLQQVGGLDEGENITATGRLLLQFPIDPERAKALITAKDLGVLPETVVALSIMDAEGIFYRPREDELRKKVLVEEPVYRHFRKQSLVLYLDRFSDPDPNGLPAWATQKGAWYELDCSHRAFPGTEGQRSVARVIRSLWSGDSRSDFVAVVRAYRAFKAEERRLQKWASQRKAGTKPGPSRESRLREWCKNHFINFKRLRIAEQTMRELREELADSPLGAVYGLADEREFDPDALTKALLTGMPDNVAKRSEVNGRVSFGGAMGDFSPGSTMPGWDEPLILIDRVRQIPGSRRDVADLAAPVERSWLAELMPHMVNRTRSKYMTYDPYRDQVMQALRTQFGELVFEDEVAAQSSPKAAAVFAEWLAGAVVAPKASAEVAAVVEANAEIIRRWHQLHRRMCIRERSFREDYEVLLDGACRQADIRDAEALLLDPPDEAREVEVLTGRPQSIEVLGRSQTVAYGHQYGDGGPSMPTLNWSDLQAVWQLPDEGIRLPDGTEVEVVVSRHTVALGPWDFRGTVAELKAKLAEHGHGQQFKDWKRPELPLPRNGDLAAEIPPVVIAEYGRDPLSGEQLFAYGAVELIVWSGRPAFQAVWTRDAQEAEAIAEASRVAMAPFHDRAEQQRRERELRDAQDRARSQYRQLRQLRERLEAVDPDDSLAETLWLREQEPSAEDPAAVLARVAEIEVLLDEWQPVVVAAESEYARLFSRAQASVDQADQLLDRFRALLSEDTVAKLEQLAVDDDQMPRTIQELRSWGDRMRAALATAEVERKQPGNGNPAGVSDDALARLQAAFSRPGGR